jgi:hypothetical protein
MEVKAAYLKPLRFPSIKFLLTNCWVFIDEGTLNAIVRETALERR